MRLDSKKCRQAARTGGATPGKRSRGAGGKRAASGSSALALVTLAAAVALFGPHYRLVFPDSSDLIAWVDRKHERVVRIEVNRDGVIETITISAIDSLLEEKQKPVPAALSSRRLATGRGLALGETAGRVLALYGPPNSRGPSTRGSRALQFLFYAFDWAGPDVPQVMEVYCDARSGRVVEITLAAPTL